MKELNECVSRNEKKLEKIKVEKGRGSTLKGGSWSVEFQRLEVLSFEKTTPYTERGLLGPPGHKPSSGVRFTEE